MADLTTLLSKFLEALYTGTASFTGSMTAEQPGIVTTSTDGLVVSNATASTSGVAVQQSPRLRFRSHVWNTTATAADNTDDLFIESVPASGTTPSGLLKIGSILNGAAATYPLTLTSGGALSVLGQVTGTNFLCGAGGQVYWSTRSTMQSTADSQVGFGNNANTTLASVDFGPSGGALTSRRLQKKITGIADNSTTAVFTVTIPNANHACGIRLMFVSSNGSTDAWESTRAMSGMVVLTRVLNADTVAVAVTATDAVIATSAAGATHTLAYAVTAMTGLSSAQQTFTINVVIDDTGNTGANQVMAIAETLNSNITGVTIA